MGGAEDGSAGHVLAKREPLGAGVLRILRAELAEAEAALDGAPGAQAVHGFRRSTKRARTALRLLRPALGDAHYHEVYARIRDAAGALSSRRDAEVMRTLALRLAERAKKPAAASLRAFAAAEPPALDGAADPAERARAGIREARAALEHVAADPDWDDAVERALARLEKRAKRAWRAARDGADDEALHRWRKRVKDCFHAAKLLKAHARSGARRRIKSLDRLGETLGQDHDLAVLAAALAAGPRVGADGAAGADGTDESDGKAGAAQALIARRRRKLQAKAHALAEDVYRRG